MKKLLCLILVLALSGIATAAKWEGDVSTDWNDSDNWVDGVMPASGAGGKAMIYSGTYECTHASGTADIYALDIGRDSGGDMTMSGGTINIDATKDMYMYTGTGGTLTMTGGTINLGKDLVGTATAGTAYINMSDGTIQNRSGSKGGLYLGHYTLATALIDMTMSGGNINVYNLGMQSGSSLDMDGDGQILITYDSSYSTSETWAQFKTRITGYASLMDNEVITVNDTAETITITPEPATIALLGLGGLALIRRKR